MLGNKKVFVDTCIVIEYLKENLTMELVYLWVKDYKNIHKHGFEIC
jgi:hypothetical protein